MRILFATMPFDGHFRPLTGLAVHLRERGHDVRWYAGPDYAGTLERLAVPHLPFRRADDLNGENLAERHPEREKLKGPKLIAFDFEYVFVSNAESHFLDIAEIREEFPFEALVCDDALSAMKLVDELLGVPVYPVGVASMTFNSADAPPSFFGLAPARNPWDRLKHRVVRAMVNSTMKPGLSRFNDVLERHGLEPLTDPSDYFDLPAHAATAFFQIGVPALEFPRSDLPECVEYVGALLPYSKAEPSELPHRAAIEAAGSVVVVSQGTVDNREPEKLIAPALEALGGSEHLVIATTGGRNTEALRRRFRAENVLVEDFIDYSVLLPEADVFVTNGGFGSVMLALNAGTPLVLAGTREGKNDVNVRIAHAGLGIDLKTERPTAGRIAAAVRAVTSGAGDPDYTENVRRLRSDLASYEPLTQIEQRITHSRV